MSQVDRAAAFVGLMAALQIAASGCAPKIEASTPNQQVKPNEAAKVLPSPGLPTPVEFKSIFSREVGHLALNPEFLSWADRVTQTGARIQLIDMGPTGIRGTVVNETEKFVRVLPEQMAEQHPGFPRLEVKSIITLDLGVSIYRGSSEKHWASTRFPAVLAANPRYLRGFVLLSEVTERDQGLYEIPYINPLQAVDQRAVSHEWREIRSLLQ